MNTDVAAFLASPSWLAIEALLVGTFVVFVIGVTAALRDGTFKWVYIDSFVRTTVLGRIVPVAVVLVAGWTFKQDLLTAAGLATAAAVATGMLASIVESLRQIASEPKASAAANEPPKA